MRVGDSKNKSFKPYFPVVVFIGLNDETGFFYSQKHIQANVAGVDFRLWVIESDADVRNFVLEADKVLDSDAFKGLFAAVEATLAVAFPTLSGVIAVSGV
ncbi:MAG: hypothetical protein LBC19_00870, partial [Tannerella sp.]|nr:hypothetical protein [Tannerella sp.]